MKTRGHEQGSTLTMALIALFVLAFSASSVFYFIANRYQTAFQSTSWNEALVVAESGVDLAMLALNNSATDPSTAWTGWTPSDATTFPKTYKGSVPAHTGDGNNKMYVSVKVDNSIVDSSGNTWPRITSSGTTEVPGLPRVGYAPAVLTASGAKSHYNILRRITMKNDVTIGALHLPQTTRTVQVVAKGLPISIFRKAVVVKGAMTMSGAAYTDSFDSSDPTKSTNGQYDQSKRQSHGDVATNSSGTLSDLKNGTVYGNAYSNGGTIKNTGGVKGTVYNNFSTTINPVSNPTFSTFNSSPTQVSTSGNSTVTLTAGTQAAPANYILSKISVSGGSQLILAPPSPGQDSYINIWVTGDITTSGTGYIQQLAGVHATIWVNGKVAVSGNAFDNENNVAADLTINGVTPANGATNTFAISGNGTFIGVVNAPSYDLTISGSGDLMGAFITHSMTFSGAAGFHYDEALGGTSGANGLAYTFSSWVEDVGH